MSNERELEVAAEYRVAVVAASRALALAEEGGAGVSADGWAGDLLQAHIAEAEAAYARAKEAWDKFVARRSLSDMDLSRIVADAERIDAFICWKE
jgi:hypothetical protein